MARSMRRTLLLGVTIASMFVGIAPVIRASPQARRSGQPPAVLTPDSTVTPERINRFERWLKAVDRHEPGTTDDALEDVASWPTADLRPLWADVKFLAALMRNLKLARVAASTPSGNVEVVYSAVPLQRMRAMACAASGRLASIDCIALHAAESLDDDLRRLGSNAAADRTRSGEDNYILRRAALLHTDIEILAPASSAASPPAPPRTAPVLGPTRVRADTVDGMALNVHEVGIHWEIARTALDAVRPKNAEKPQPDLDPMVRQWYRATSAWMQHVENHDTQHVDRAREIFPTDPDILFLNGTLHETYARAEIQAASRSVALPTGFTLDVGSTRAELRQAEGFFRRALAHAPEMAEAHLRLGRVLGLQGHHADAVAELRQALTLLDDNALRYDGELFAGAEEEALGHYDAAGEAYARAGELYPGAQSPLIALSQLARRRGDRAGALASIQRVFALPQPGDEGREDPWWTYHLAQARNAEELLDAVRAPFRRSEQ
jgi:tetratricopeptide (TPR) repeat protein